MISSRPAKPENALDLGGFTPHDPGRINIRVGHDAARDLGSIGAEHTDRIAPLKPAERGYNTRRQQALPLAQGLERAVVDCYGAGRLQSARDPLFAGGSRRGVRHEPGTTRSFFETAHRMFG